MIKTLIDRTEVTISRAIEEEPPSCARAEQNQPTKKSKGDYFGLFSDAINTRQFVIDFRKRFNRSPEDYILEAQPRETGKSGYHIYGTRKVMAMS